MKIEIIFVIINAIFGFIKAESKTSKSFIQTIMYRYDGPLNHTSLDLISQELTKR